MISPFFNYDLITAWYDRKSKPEIKTLRDLRLVSKRFDIAARAVLFRSTHGIWVPGNPNPWWAFASNLPCSGRPPKHLKHLKINLGPAFTSSTLLEESQTEYENHLNSTTAYITDFSKDISSTSELRSLDIYTGQWASRFTFDFGVPGGHARADRVDAMHLTFFMAKLCRALSKSSFFPHLTELRLSLPCSHNYKALRQVLPASLLLQLKKLFLAVADATGPGGSREYLIYADETHDGDDDYPLSDLQEQFPNREHAHWMFEIAAQCPNLDTLALESTHRLDCDLLTLSTSNLSSFFLHRMTVSASKLIELLLPSTLSRLWIQDTELTSGSWDEVFDHLQKCNKLEYLNPSNCSYARGGSSFHLKAWIGREWEFLHSLWSKHEPDNTALVRLVEGLAEKAGGMEKYPDLLMEQAMLSYEVEGEEDTDDEDEDEDEDFIDDYEDLHDYASGGSDFDGEDEYDENFHY
ncbi:hypothetical protein BDZ45DRAFT_308565 [Acephala macrosclerotiorum]|nr:hypothetical protein BDZ45DRAFT_308565 [Acephala macrosclerotiorum]